MELILDRSEFTHQKEMSHYNSNYFKHNKLNYIIREVCHEDDNYYSYYLVEDGKDIFLGDHDGEDSEILKIEFKIHYT